MNLSKFNSTKFVATMAAGISVSLLQAFEKLDPAGNSYMLVMIGTIGAFIAGNVMQAKNESLAKGKE